MDKQYAKRDIMALDKQAGHYWRHVNAMTAEGLHSKSDIAAELAYRDARIAELEAHVERLDNELQEKALTDDGVLADAYWNCADKITPWLGEKTGPDTLINSVAQSLEFLIEQWREKKIIEQERNAYRAAEEAQIALRQKMEEERDALAAHVERFGECRLQSGRISLLRVRSLLSDSPTTSLARRDEESMRKGFWWGFERARMHPAENNIAAEWQSVTALMKSNEEYRQLKQAEANQ